MLSTFYICLIKVMSLSKQRYYNILVMLSNFFPKQENSINDIY